MKTVVHSAHARDTLLHIETEGCVVNIQIGLRDQFGRRVTSVRILPDDESRGGDAGGRLWHQADMSRVIADLVCRACGHVWGGPSPGDDGIVIAPPCPKARPEDRGARNGGHDFD